MTGDTLPKQMTLKPSRLKWAVTLLICVGFVVGILLVVPPAQQPMMRWGSVIFFSIGALASLPGLFGVGGLDLDPEGFTIRAMGRTTRRKWAECSEFSIVRIRTAPFVAFSSETDERHALAGTARELVGSTGMLPDRYGMKAQKLADLMNAFRARALGR